MFNDNRNDSSVRGPILRKDGKKYFADILYWLPDKPEGHNIWKVTIFHETIPGLVDEVYQVKKNYEAKNNKKCRLWKVAQGPDRFIRVIDRHKEEQRKYARQQSTQAAYKGR